MSLHELVIAAARRDPRALAVDGPAGRLRYGELDLQADALAHRLAAIGVGPGDRVIVWGGKTPAVIVAMQAVLRLGAAYVPANANTPPGRMALMAADCAARAVCAAGEQFGQLPADLGPGTARVNLAEPFHAGESPAPVDHQVAPGDLAYILYTSGSTGTPKGVCITHGNARAFVDWSAAELRATPTDRFANHASFTFDLSVLDLYAAFAAGATVCPVPAELAYAPRELVAFLRDERITVWYSVPSALVLMIRDGGLLDTVAPAPLRAVLFAGEPMPIAYVRQLAGWTRARLLNLYGPTETNVCTYHEVVPADLERDCPVPIGRASCGDKVWAARPDGAVAAPGEEGELTVDGPTVMRGYWGRPSHRGSYPTGDVVRVLPDGSFDYVGRNDHMVKIRGYRVELGEIESVLGSHPDVAQVAVVTAGEGLGRRLVAFVVPAPGATAGVIALKAHSSRRLAPYMIPDEVRFLTELPRTANGKVNRSALVDATVSQVREERTP